MSPAPTASPAAEAAVKGAGNKFGTFAGVFTPSILTILGVIMFLRAGYVVGAAGIGLAIVILLLSTGITLLTALSVAAVATNTPVRGGGAYFLISRALGWESGGAVGLALFLAQALSVPFYIVGFTEALVQSFPALKPWFLVIATGTTIALFALNYRGAGSTLKAQFVVMAILVLAIVSFLVGAVLRFRPDLFATNWRPPAHPTTIGFWALFAVYFPAVTGILAGINMSGDLRDPARSLVRGTLAAIAAGAAIYLLQMLLCGGSQVRTDLVERPYRMLIEHAFLAGGYLVIAGVCAATLSSAIGSFLGAPRVLQAVARDHIIPGLARFARGTRHGDEPREALWLTLGIALVVVVLASGSDSLGAFDRVASVVTMFFLCTYGTINLAAFVESFGANPSFRPRFRFYHWTTSLLGAVLCAGVMLLIDPVAAVVAATVIGGLYALIGRRVYRSAFGDARRGFLYALLRRTLLRLDALHPDPKNWRPTFLVLSGNPRTRETLLRYAVWLEAQRGIVSAVQILTGRLEEMAPRRRPALELMKRFLRENDLPVFPQVLVANDLDEGIRMLAQAHTLGPVATNTVLLGWPGAPDRVGPFVHHLRALRALGRSVVCVVDRGLPPEELEHRRIDLWWRGRENGSLMMILAYLLTCNAAWSRSRIRVLRRIESEAGREEAHRALAQLVAAARIEAEVQVVVSEDAFPALLARHSGDAQVVFLGLSPPEEEDAAAFYERYDVALAELPTTLLVHSSGEADLLA